MYILYIHIGYIYLLLFESPSHPAPHPTPLCRQHRVGHWAPCVINHSFPLAVYFTQGGVYVSKLSSRSVPPNPNTALFLLLLRPSPLLPLFFQISSCLRTTSFFLKRWKTLLLVQKPKVINNGRE